MLYRQLGRTDAKVSLITLGTMTWGQQNTEADAHSQLDLAVERGINLIDVAEMYPVPPKAETQGLSERYLGTWLKKSGLRDKLLIATKCTGPARKPHNPRHIRGGVNDLDRKGLTDALHGSLERLQLDHVDLYQLHWPDRTVNSFGQLGYQHVADEKTVPIEETLKVLSEFVQAGKIRHIGLSNETSWGVAQFLRAAEQHGLERVVTIQNPYNLLNRSFEINLAEFAHREQVGLLAYSPLAFGMLSGKYLNGARPAAGRLTLFERFVRYTSPQAERATAEYVALAKRHGLDPAQMALAYVNSRPFLTSNIIGATTLDQLRSNLDSLQVQLSDEVIAGIEAIHKDQPNPAP
ncbi:NADP(H)-dependent aldo-keto reductase [Herbaspirillum chlorophenolicum]|uniref:NADP(H)-dependent aldo-keto reductase n=1 Tax=Herbaspirillum chlorophenolicum TaxID=211589 RepID=UPI00067C031E|nr:NADP(H)-dependent aldo-keto reductase [Herbaspirillum chlorophenolicum]